jgi:c-di-GMP-binding flagellar brake protein YcgR
MHTVRKYTRWQLDRPAKIRLEGAEAWTGCVISDLSFCGCMVALAIRLPKDSFIRAEIFLSEECSLDLEAWVVWHRPAEGNNVYGLYFTRITDSDKEKIYKFVQSNYSRQLHAKWVTGLEKEEEKACLPAGREGGEKMEDRRIFQRFPVNLAVRFFNLTSGSEGKAQALNISAKGIGLTLSEEIKPRSALELWLEVSEKGEPLYTRGDVVWSRPDAAGKFSVGISLEKADLMGLSRALRTP